MLALLLGSLIAASCPEAAVLSAPPVVLQEEGPETRAPGWDAERRTRYYAESAGGLRYLWWLPPEAEEEEAPRALTVILHGTGLDYRWGPANHPMEEFRPRDVVVSVDGTSPGQGESRLFLGADADVEAFEAFLGELREALQPDQVFLYGHSQGGFFVIHYACAKPDTVDGVVAHASGAWAHSQAGKKVHGVPIAFLHGTRDPVVPYANSTGSFRAYQEMDFPMLHLRRMEGYNHWPNGVRSTECLDWCEGMTTTSPERALLLAGELARPKRADGYGYEQPPDWAGARMVLRRLSGEGEGAFKEVDEKTARAAKKLVDEVEDAAEEQVKVLRKAVGKKLEFDDGDWPARFRAVRADFRGTVALEEWLDSIGWEKAEKKQRRAAEKLLEAWWKRDAPDVERMEAVLEHLPEAFLYDSFPTDFEEQLGEMLGRADRMDLKRKARNGLPEIEAWLEGLPEGRKEYRKDWPKP